jgi:hypothetical protein
MADVSTAGALLGVIAFAQSALTMLLDKLGAFDPVLEKVIKTQAANHSIDGLDAFLGDEGSGEARLEAVTRIGKLGATLTTALIGLFVSHVGLGALILVAHRYEHGPWWMTSLVVAAYLAAGLFVILLVRSLTGRVNDFSPRPPTESGDRGGRLRALVDLATPTPYLLFLAGAALLSALAGVYFA